MTTHIHWYTLFPSGFVGRLKKGIPEREFRRISIEKLQISLFTRVFFENPVYNSLSIITCLIFIVTANGHGRLRQRRDAEI